MTQKNKLQLTESRYLKNGTHFWQGNFEQALLVLRHGYRYNSIYELFEAFEFSTESLFFLRSWSFGEVICSTFSRCYNNKVSNSLNWDSIFLLLLASKNEEASNTLFLFLEKNIVLAQISKQIIAVSASQALRGETFLNVKEKKLLNFLNFLQISEKSKQNIINTCIKTNELAPLFDFLRNPENLEVSEKSNINLTETSLLEKEVKINKPMNHLDYIKLFVSIGFVLAILSRLLNGITHKRQNLFELPKRINSVCYSISQADLGKVGYLRGGMNTSIKVNSNARLFPSTTRVSPRIERRTMNNSTQFSKVKKSTYSKKEVMKELTPILKASRFSYRDENGRKVSLNYKNSGASAYSLRINFNETEGFVSFSGSITSYDCYEANKLTFSKRLEYALKELETKGNTSFFTMQKNIETPSGKIESTVPNGDHIEGIKVHRCTERDQADTLVVVKPYNIHKEQTFYREQIESELLIGAGKEENKTNFAEGHDIKTYFTNCVRDSKKSLLCINPKHFTGDSPPHVLVNAETKALTKQRRAYILRG